MAQDELRAVIRELLVAELKAIGHEVAEPRKGAAPERSANLCCLLSGSLVGQ